MHCPTAWGQWAVKLLQCTAPLPGGIGQCNFCNTLPHCLGAVGSATPAMHRLTALGAVGSGPPAMHCPTSWGQLAVDLLQPTASLPGAVGSAIPAMGGRSVVPGLWGCTTGRDGPGGMGSPTQGVVGASFRAYGGPSASGNRAHRPGGDGESRPGRWSEPPAGPMGRHHLLITGQTSLAGTGSPAQGVVGASCKAYGGQPSSENRVHRPWGDGESSPGGVRSLLPGLLGAIFFREPGAPAPGEQGVQPRGCSEPPARPMGGHLLPRTGRTGPGGTGSPAQGVFGVSCQANGGTSSSENRALQPGGDGESCPGGVRSLLPGQWGAIFFREPGAPARGGRGVLPRGCSESPARPVGGHLLQRTGRTGPGGTGSPAQGVFGVSSQANGGPSSSVNRAHRPGGDWESCPGGVRSLLQGRGGAIFFREPGAPARGGRGFLPRGCSGPPARASGRPSSSENRAHRPGGDGESCPGGVRSLLLGQWGASLFREPGAPARGGREVQPRGYSDSPARPMGGPYSSENQAHRPGGDRESCPGGVRSLLPGQGGAIFVREPGAPARGGRGVLPRGCSESPARPMGGHLLQRTGRTGLEGDGESCPGGVRSLLPGQWGAIFCREPGAPARGGRGVLPRRCSESPARPRRSH